MDNEYENEVRRAIVAARARGAELFHDVLSRCEGADPRVVAKLASETTDPLPRPPAIARRETSELAALFPAADPIACQWWFTLDSIERLATSVYQWNSPDSKVAFLGAPTVAFQYSRRFGAATALDVDTHVIDSLSGSDGLEGVKYDVSAELPPDHRHAYGTALVDPPWYPELIRAFLNRAFQLVGSGGHVFCSLPPRLTRPGIVRERQLLLQELLSARHEIEFIEPGATRYLMPQFECAAFADIPDIDGRPWRSGDLLCVRKNSDKLLNVDSIAPYEVISYARSPKRFRVFFRTSHDSSGDASSWIQKIPEFERTVSRRHVDPTQLHWWTSSKQGGRLRDPKSFDLALQAWAKGRTREEAIKTLVDASVRDTDAHALCAELDEKLALWTQHGTGVAKLGLHAKYVPVTKPGVFATTQSSNRPYPKEPEDGYRTDPFQRDRDRITWSRGIRQLSGKTQVFSLESDDFLRNRLAHSMEVAQLASTIGSSFGLDPRLIEAGSLAHDVGHTPFGHAGEDALNVLFDEISPELGGFNHYEHGVDVIRWLEDAYHSPALGGLPGLNLSSEVAECVFKHTYCQSNGHFSQNEIYQRSKHQKYFSNNLCHVEGQAVRIADKISYLISDIEDGIRVGALDVKHLVSCRLLRRAPLDFVVSSAESLLERFLSQRGLLIGILMEDVIESTDERLSRLGRLDAVRSASRYTVDHSEELQTEVDEVWEKLQVGVLHRDARVRIANLRAAKTVRELAILFAVAPELVDARFSSSHARLSSTDYMSHYHKRVGRKVTLSPAIVRVVAADGGRSLGFRPCDPMQVPVENLVQAKDFVAGLSDARARIVHRTLMSS